MSLRELAQSKVMLEDDLEHLLGQASLTCLRHDQEKDQTTLSSLRLPFSSTNSRTTLVGEQDLEPGWWPPVGCEHAEASTNTPRNESDSHEIEIVETNCGDKSLPPLALLDDLENWDE